MRTRSLSIVIAAAVALAACSDSDPTLPPRGGEPNDSIGQATPIATGAPVGAAIDAPADVDYYAIAVPAGGAFVRVQTFDASGATCDAVSTFTELYSAGGSLLGWDDDSGPNLCDDLRLWEAEGVYYVAVSHGGGASEAFPYVLLVTLTPGSAGAEIEPNGNILDANGSYLADAVVTGSISPSTDYDYFAITNDSASSRIVHLETFSGGIGYCSSGDSVIALYGAAGALLRSDDDSGIGLCSFLSHSFPAHTTYYVAVRSFGASYTFPYLLEIDFL